MNRQPSFSSAIECDLPEAQREPDFQSAPPDAPSPSRELAARLEVLADLDSVVAGLISDHESKRELWFPSDLFGEEEQDNPETWRQRIRKLAEGLPDPCRVAIALNLVTEEGLPHFHRLVSKHFGQGTSQPGLTAAVRIGRACRKTLTIYGADNNGLAPSRAR